MEYKSLGRTGLKVSELCLGTMQFGWTADESLSLNIMSTAFDAGINFIDTADVYSRWVEGNPGGVAETIIGKWIKQADIPRDQLVLATKVRGKMGTGPNDEGLSRKHILQAVDASLRRLGVDYIDLYQTHSYDDKTPIEETLRAMDNLVHQGKVRYIGCSNYPAWRLTEALWTSQVNHLTRFDSLQPHFNLVRRAEFERELSDVCQAYGLGVIPYSPLAAGFLTEKYNRSQAEPDSARIGGVRRRYFNEISWAIHEVVANLATQKGKSISQVSLAWLLSNPVITSPIIGPRDLDQLQDNLGSVEFKLTAEEKKTLDEISTWQEP
ncbi:MAG: alcohol dehydrogenase [Chloroflexi bacterium RBG_19FT_COMBO_49_13]|nr:MAG: alcohol dehydrogenase [Chloroflexi bacterium RBG_19FT_COMBO_49_13]